MTLFMLLDHSKRQNIQLIWLQYEFLFHSFTINTSHETSHEKYNSQLLLILTSIFV